MFPGIRQESWVSDLTVYGDLRDLVVQALKDDPDRFIQGLSLFGVLTTIWPPADSACSLMKVAAKENAITSGLKKVFTEAIENVDKLPKTVEQAKVLFGPIHEVSREVESFNQFRLLMAGANSLEEVAGVARFLKSYPRAARVLEPILILTSTLSDGSKRVLIYVNKFGNEGMQALYSAIRKGPVGLDLLLKYKRIPKPFYKANIATLQHVNDYWRAAKFKWGAWLEIFRFFGLFIILAFISRSAYTWIPWFSNSLQADSPSGKIPSSNRNVEKAFQWYVPIVLVIIAFILIILWQSTSPAQNSASLPFPVAMGSNSPRVQPNVSYNGSPNQGLYQQVDVPHDSSSSASLTMFLIIVFGGAQFFVFIRAKREFEVINGLTASGAIKGRHLENIEMFLDLPLYLGLFGSVLSFIIITLWPSQAGRLLAYVSTLFGIGFSGTLKFYYLYPTRRELIKASQETSAPKEI